MHVLSKPGRLFEKLQRIDKAYRKFFQQELQDWNFTPNEIVVLVFLHNNAPDRDTATDIARCRGLSKGLVARSVDSLCQKGYLETVRDSSDRRIVHLHLTPFSEPLRRLIEEKQEIVRSRIRNEINPEALRITSDTLDQLLNNTEQLLKEDLKSC